MRWPCVEWEDHLRHLPGVSKRLGHAGVMIALGA